VHSVSLIRIPRQNYGSKRQGLGTSPKPTKVVYGLISHKRVIGRCIRLKLVAIDPSKILADNVERRDRVEDANQSLHFDGRPIQLSIGVQVAVAFLLQGCASAPPPGPPPRPAPAVQIQYDRYGHNVRNPMGLTPDVAVNVVMTDPTAYAHMIVDYYDKHPECQL